MNIKSLIKEFRKSFPEFEESSNKELNRWGREKPPEMVFFGTVLDRHLIEELSSMKNKHLLDRIFTFLEHMALSKDKEVEWVLTTTILDYLGDNKQILEKARSLMGPVTLRLSHEVEKSLGRE